MSNENSDSQAVSIAKPVVQSAEQLVAGFGPQIQQFSGELRELFPERDHLINQIVYALLSREHVLVQGIFGTAKSLLVKSVFGAFEDASCFSMEFNKFHTETHVFGVPDPRKFRDEGIVHYNRTGNLLDAHFFWADEILDASGPLLRVLLGVLNEREFKRGQQYEKANLHTSLAATNVDPDKAVKQTEGLDAVIDRFLFRCKVGYLKDSSSRLSMYRHYLANASSSVTKMPYAALDAVSQIVANTDMIDDGSLLDGYEAIMQAYCGRPNFNQVVSDRRRCKLLRVAQANAVLHGRVSLEPQDLTAVRWALCVGNDMAQHDAFLTAADPIVKSLESQRQNNVDQLCLKLLKKFAKELPEVPAQCQDDQLVKVLRAVGAMRKEILGLHPTLPSTEELKQGLLRRLAQTAAAAQERISESVDS